MTHSLTCTFCRKSEHEVRKLVAGPGVYICDACIEIAHAIVNDTAPPSQAPWWHRAAERLGHALIALTKRPHLRYGAISS